MKQNILLLFMQFIKKMEGMGPSLIRALNLRRVNILNSSMGMIGSKLKHCWHMLNCWSKAMPILF